MKTIVRIPLVRIPLVRIPLVRTPFVRATFQLATLLLLSVALVACGGEREGRNQARNQPQQEQRSNAPQQAANAGTGNSGTANADVTIVNVVARDFEYIMDANRAAAGSVTFVVTNEGSMPHDFAITIDGERHKTKMIQPGTSGSLTVELSAGGYEYICTIPGHDILGMKGTFTVN